MKAELGCYRLSPFICEHLGADVNEIAKSRQTGLGDNSMIAIRREQSPKNRNF